MLHLLQKSLPHSCHKWWLLMLVCFCSKWFDEHARNSVIQLLHAQSKVSPLSRDRSHAPLDSVWPSHRQETSNTGGLCDANCCKWPLTASIASLSFFASAVRAFFSALGLEAMHVLMSSRKYRTLSLKLFLIYGHAFFCSSFFVSVFSTSAASLMRTRASPGGFSWISDNDPRQNWYSMQRWSQGSMDVPWLLGLDTVSLLSSISLQIRIRAFKPRAERLNARVPFSTMVSRGPGWRAEWRYQCGQTGCLSSYVRSDNGSLAM